MGDALAGKDNATQGFSTLEGIIAFAGKAQLDTPQGYTALGALQCWVATHPNDDRAVQELMRYTRILHPDVQPVAEPV